MKDNKKRGLFEIGITTVKILLFVLLGICALVFIYYGFIDKGEKIERDKVQRVSGWSVTDSDEETQTISTTLPQDIQDNEYLYFDTRNDVSIYINGELRKDFVESRDVNIPGGSFKRFIMSVPLYASDSGAEVSVRRGPQDIDTGVPEFFLGTRGGIVSYLFKTIGPLFILSFIVLIFSFVSFIVSIVLTLMYKHRIDMLYGTLAIFTIAAWLIMDSYLFPFVLGVNHVNGILSFMFCLMIPLPLLIYLTSIQKNRYKKSVLFLMLVVILNVVLWPLLHYTGIQDFYYLIDPANGVLIFLAVSGIVILIVDAMKGHTASYHYTFIGFFGFLVGCLIELTSILFDIKITRESIPIVVGLAFFLTFIVIQQVHDLRMINKDKQHAIDISEAKTRFLASMSHEIRTPINAILGMNEMILRENNDTTIEEYSRNIKTSGKMLLMLVNDVLDFTKIESGKLEVKEEDFLMSDLLYDVVSLIKERTDEKNLTLETKIADNVPNGLVSDEFRIRQILINFLNNAVKYTDDGTVTLEVGGTYIDDGYELKLTVKDTGKGIREEDQDYLFDAFSRADVKANANIEGTGLGLAIVKSIVDSMNGTVGVESEFGVGSEFWVKLPVKYETEEFLRQDFMDRKIEQKTISKKGSFAAPDARILAVDDNQSNLTIVKLFLKRNAIVPDLCSSGEKAIELCKEKEYDLILMDHMMPEPDGIEALHIIREDEASLNRDTKAVVLTANAVAGSRKMYIKAGFDDYLTKPLDSNVLEEIVRKMLPEDKVIEAKAKAAPDNDNEESAGTLRSRLSAIEGFNYNTALTYCGGEEDLLMEIIGDIVKECPARVERMKRSLESKDIKAYKIDAHSIKSSMATIGLNEFSERAKKHEFAARDGNIDYINGDADAFINDYKELCERLKNCEPDKEEVL